ncbi:mate-domain-containing protein [Kalaharituber pfeilii]|nr:mate-domain-containing protein [Kalaharituber pfeilii]
MPSELSSNPSTTIAGVTTPSNESAHDGSPTSFFRSRLSSSTDCEDSPAASETTPLFRDLTKSCCSRSVTSERDGECYLLHDAPNSAVSEFFFLLKSSLPVIVAYALQNSLQTTSVLIVGHISPEHLATAAFSYMFAMSTAWLIALGGTTALDTLCSSSFTGSKNRYELGILLQRAFVVLGAMYVIVALIWWNSQPIFVMLGQEPELARTSALFLRYLIPGGLGYIYFESVKKYLQAQGIMRAGTYVLLITAPLNMALNYVFVYTFELGLIGAPLATGVSYWLNFLGLMGYARFVKGGEAWGGWSRECLNRMGVFARLAGLGVVQVGTEWWAFEIVALAAGRLGTVPLASQSVIMTTDQVLNTIPFGIGVAASTRVGNMLGARNSRGASRSANTAAVLSIVIALVVLVVLMCVKDVYARIFSDDVEVIELTSRVMPYVALFQVADGLNGSCGGSLRGMGRQHTGAMVNIVSYYCGALPLGIYLAFYRGWGLEGLWVGQCIALYLVGAAEYVLVWASKWDEQVDKAFERMDEGERVERGDV